MSTEPSFIYKRVDNNIIPEKFDEVRLFAVARNESLRLPYFLKYYFEKGIDRIFLIDNNSTDNTVEIALSYPNIHVFNINEGYRNYWNWMEYFLEKYGTNYWCVVADIDELLYFPHSESLNIKDLIKYFENNNYTALRSLLLDMYSEYPIAGTIYIEGEDPLECCQFFDPHYYTNEVSIFDKKNEEEFKTVVFQGGMRERVFGNVNGNRCSFYLSKVPLFKYTSKTYLILGCHAINKMQIADIQGAVIHTKFMHDFIQEASEESLREEHWAGAAEYKIYNTLCLQNRYLSLKYDGSVQYKNTQELVKLGIMKDSPNFREFFKLSNQL